MFRKGPLVEMGARQGDPRESGDTDFIAEEAAALRDITSSESQREGCGEVQAQALLYPNKVNGCAFQNELFL